MIKICQRDNRILQYLKENKSGLTVSECTRKLKTTELRKGVSNLCDKGYKIGSVWESGLNSFVEPTRYKRYFYLGRACDDKQ